VIEMVFLSAGSVEDPLEGVQTIQDWSVEIV
jgi:hypothetical protein